MKQERIRNGRCNRVARLEKPDGLSEARDFSHEFFTNAKKSIVKRLFENGDEKQLIRFFSFGFFASKSLDNFIKLASEKEMVVLVSYLLEEQKKKSPKKSTKFNI